MIQVYVALALLSLLGLLIAMTAVSVKTWIVTALALTATCVSVLWAVPDVDGFAKAGAPSPTDRVNACLVDEPNFVYFWAGTPPVSYRLKYDRGLHAVCDTVQQAAKQGVRVGVDVRKSRRQVYQLPPAAAGVKEDRDGG